MVKRALHGCALVFVTAATWFVPLVGADVSTLKVGMGETVITPPVGTPMAGYRRTEVSKGVHDDLHARSLALQDQQGNSVVLMTVSVLNLGRPQVEAIRTKVEQATGIPGPNILISANHTHSGPSVGQASAEYQKFLTDRCAESAIRAWSHRVPGRIGAGSVEVLGLGMNNRRLAYGGLHPDPQAGILRIEDSAGKLRGVAFIFGCHPSTLSLHNLLFTEDWPYYSIQELKKKLGPDIWVAYYQSAQGDVKVGYTAEHSAVGAEMPIRNWWFAEVKGKMMAEAVRTVLPSIRAEANLQVKSVTDSFDFPLRRKFPISLEEAESQAREAKERLARLETAVVGSRPEDVEDRLPMPPAWHFQQTLEPGRMVWGHRLLDDARVEAFLTDLNLGTARWFYSPDRSTSIRLEQQAIRVGDIVFISFPGEVFSEIGLKVKKQSPFPRTFVIGLANAGGTGGYLATAAEYLEGGYEVIASRFSPKAEQTLITSSLGLIGRLRK